MQYLLLQLIPGCRNVRNRTIDCHLKFKNAAMFVPLHLTCVGSVLAK